MSNYRPEPDEIEQMLEAVADLRRRGFAARLQGMSTAPKSNAADGLVETDEASDWLDYARKQWAQGVAELDQGKGVVVRNGAELLERVRTAMRSR